MVHGGLLGGEVVAAGKERKNGENIDYLISHGMSRRAAAAFLEGLQVWPQSRIEEAGRFLQTTFYEISGWKPDLMKENQLKNQQRRQISEAIEEQKKYGRTARFTRSKRSASSLRASGQATAPARAGS